MFHWPPQVLHLGSKTKHAAEAAAVRWCRAQIVTISGRTIRKEALASPDLAVSAIRHIEDLLALVPRDALKQAEAFRSQRRGVSA